jgi:hypothetical protein
MAKKLAKVTRTTTRQDYLNIMRDSYLFGGAKEARYALGATSLAWRVWMIAMTQNPPQNIESKLTIPGCGTISIAWTGYDGRFAPRLKLRFRPIAKIQNQIKQHNLRAYREWKKNMAVAAATEEEKNNPDTLRETDGLGAKSEPNKS